MKNKSQGFTLPELLVVVLIIAILATIGYPSYQRYVRKTRLESVRSELLINAQNLERYYAQHATVKAEAGNPKLPTFSPQNPLFSGYFTLFGHVFHGSKRFCFIHFQWIFMLFIPH